LKDFKKQYLTTATGAPLFTEAQLQQLAMLLPGDIPQEEAPTTNDIEPRQLNPAEPPPLGQPSQNGTMQTNNNDATVTDANQPEALHRIPLSLGNVIWKVKEILHDLTPPLFIDLCRAVETSQAVSKANAQLEATLKKKQTLDMAAIIEADLESQNTVAPENMKELVNSLVDLRMNHQTKQSKKAVLQAARKKSLGGDNTAKPPPKKLKNGGILKGNSRKVSFRKSPSPPPAKRQKRQSSTQPDRDYKQLKQQRKNPNPYAKRNNSNKPSRPGRDSSFQGCGRGRGRNPGRGGYNNARGRGRGRF
jgi:hypothetical protein